MLRLCDAGWVSIEKKKKKLLTTTSDFIIISLIIGIRLNDALITLTIYTSNVCVTPRLHVYGCMYVWRIVSVTHFTLITPGNWRCGHLTHFTLDYPLYPKLPIWAADLTHEHKKGPDLSAWTNFAASTTSSCRSQPVPPTSQACHSRQAWRQA
jgi:hypothetical protein